MAKSNSTTTGIKSFQSDASISPWIYKRSGCGASTSEITTITVTPVYIPSTLTVVGSVTADSFISPSDKILKENITPITEQKAKQLLSLTPVEYNLKIDSNKKLHNGLIAQEVERFFPELVEQGSLGHKHINYVEMISIIISQMKNMQTEMDCLKEQICQLSKDK
tara:strand:+ start:2216 stop:2710 length:495 start_codon:yes stop_codon:yes gene_type:complete